MSTQADCRNCRVACYHAGKRNPFMQNGNMCSSFRSEAEGPHSDEHLHRLYIDQLLPALYTLPPLFTVDSLVPLFATFRLPKGWASQPPLATLHEIPYFDAFTREIKWTR